MKKLSTFLIFLLWGCSQSPPPPLVQLPQTAPSYRVFKTANQQWQSSGIPVGNDIFLTTTSDKNPQFFWENELAPIRQKILAEHLFFVEIADQGEKSADFSPNAPLLHQTIYWFKHNQIKSGQVNKINTKTFEVTGEVGQKIQGSPLFNHNGEVLGILSQANPRTNQLTGRRLHDVLTFWAENKPEN